MTIQTQLKAKGVAEVIVVLDRPPESASLDAVASSMRKHFRSSELSHDSALLEGLSSTGRKTLRASRSKGGYAQGSRFYPNLGVLYGTVDRSGLQALKSSGQVKAVAEAVQFSLIRPVRASASTKVSGVTWGLKRLRVPELWAKGLTGRGVLVGHLDTGVDAKHPALKGAVAHFAEFDSMGQQIPNQKAWDSDNHGTHTAGTIAGREVKGVSFGVAPGATLASGIVIEGGNVIARILGGMDWAVGLRVRILSMSLGLRGFTPAFLALTQLLRRRGVLPVFAIGNEGAGTSRSPGNYAEALSIGAIDEADAVTDFSSSERFARANDSLTPDLVAPGDDILSCVPGNRYELMSGTSMATPHIAGLAALLMEAKPGATIDEIEAAIFRSCKRPRAMAETRGRRGIPDGIVALELLIGTGNGAAKKKKTTTTTTKSKKRKKA